MIHGDLDPYLHKMVYSKSVRFVLSVNCLVQLRKALEFPTLRLCKRIDKEIVIYVTFVPFSDDNVCAKQP